MNPPLVAIVGPTAVGKTELSILLAEHHGGEIISADSRQIYIGMDIGTAKATPGQRTRVPHHLLDVVTPDHGLSLAEYQRLAMAAIAAASGRGRVPFLVGGTGQYVQAVLEGWRIPAVAPDHDLRARLEAEAVSQGAAMLHARLVELDPAAADRIDYRNVRRVIRALEVCLVSGRPISELQQKEPPPYRVFRLGITRPRAELYTRIDARVDQMLTAGLAEEVRRLAAAGYGWELPAMSALGYRQIGAHLRGEISLDEAVRLIKKQTRRFVQRQDNWFRREDPVIHWADPTIHSFDEITHWVRDFLRAA